MVKFSFKSLGTDSEVESGNIRLSRLAFSVARLLSCPAMTRVIRDYLRAGIQLSERSWRIWRRSCSQHPVHWIEGQMASKQVSYWMSMGPRRILRFTWWVNFPTCWAKILVQRGVCKYILTRGSRLVPVLVGFGTGGKVFS